MVLPCRSESGSRFRDGRETGVQPARLLRRITRGDVGNVDFVDLVRLVVDLVRLVTALGFREVGGRGSHRVFARPGVREQLNIQHTKGEAKRYQIRQVVELIRRYDLGLEDRP